MIVAPTPGIPWDAPTRAVSPYWIWFRELGYPQLDIVRWPDGEWAIREYLRTPIVPSLTPHRYVLTKLRHVDISWDFIKKWCNLLDITKNHYWDLEEKKTQEVEREHKAVQRHREEFAEIGKNLVLGNRDLMERIAKNGFKEIDLENLVKHIPHQKMNKSEKQGILPHLL